MQRNPSQVARSVAAALVAGALLAGSSAAFADESYGKPVSIISPPAPSDSKADSNATASATQQLSAPSTQQLQAALVSAQAAALAAAQTQALVSGTTTIAATATPDFAAQAAEPEAQGAVSSTRSFLSSVASKAGDVAVNALNMIGVRYRWGGNSPDSGLDCSGFVRYVFQDTLGLQLPRRAEEMSRVGEKIRVSDLKPGDLVFFNTMRRSFSHVGIYIGDNKFVHSPSTGSTIRVDELDTGYWEKRFTGARRIDVSYSPQPDELKNALGALVKTSSRGN